MGVACLCFHSDLFSDGAEVCEVHCVDVSLQGSDVCVHGAVAVSCREVQCDQWSQEGSGACVPTEMLTVNNTT